ncbi:MAG: SPFH domain-containing protein [Methanobrevibacter sp.]|nr:SPFH domain-containing protein [Methanobrevibacter sp.]
MDLLKVIKFEGDDTTLVWKHPVEDFNTSSQLIVHESQEAIFYKNGEVLDLFGPGKHELVSENIPLIRNIINIPTEGETPFHVEVYFINKATSLNIEWGTSSQFQILDPTFNIPLNAGASGSMEFIIKDARKFLIKVVGTQNSINTEKLIKYFREKLSTRVKTYLAKIMSEVSYLTINQYLEEISKALEEKLVIDFDFYGVKLVNFYLSTIVIPKEDTDKVKEVLNKKMEYGTLDYNWADEQIAEISKKYADNPGMQNDVGGMIAQIPIALAFGEMLKDNIAGSFQSSFSGKSNMFSGNNSNANVANNKFCLQCGKELENDSVFCSGCGNKLTDELKCSKCGSKIKKNDKFCSQCGNRIGDYI